MIFSAAFLRTVILCDVCTGSPVWENNEGVNCLQGLKVISSFFGWFPDIMLESVSRRSWGHLCCKVIFYLYCPVIRINVVYTCSNEMLFDNVGLLYRSVSHAFSVHDSLSAVRRTHSTRRNDLRASIPMQMFTRLSGWADYSYYDAISKSFGKTARPSAPQRGGHNTDRARLSTAGSAAAGWPPCRPSKGRRRRCCRCPIHMWRRTARKLNYVRKARTIQFDFMAGRPAGVWPTAVSDRPDTHTDDWQLFADMDGLFVCVCRCRCERSLTQFYFSLISSIEFPRTFFAIG